MTAKTYRQFVSTTTIAATSGVALAIAYMATNQQEDVYLLVTAQFVAVTCVIGWIFNMLLLILPLLAQRFSNVITILLLPRSYLAEDGPDWEMVHIRRELIAKRIGTVESFFCGDSAGANSEQAKLVAGHLVSTINIESDSDRNALPTIEN